MRTTLWGTTTWTADSTAYTPLRFPGQYFDRATGLHYNYFRYYDPETARYTTPDPLGLAPSPNPTTYVPNPHAELDPLGLNSCPRNRPSITQRIKDKLRGHDPQREADERMRSGRISVPLGDLKGIGLPDFGDKLKTGMLNSLDDANLIESINNPDELGSVVTIGEGEVIQGNHRIAEALKRMNNENHSDITPETILKILAPDGIW